MWGRGEKMSLLTIAGGKKKEGGKEFFPLR